MWARMLAAPAGRGDDQEPAGRGRARVFDDLGAHIRPPRQGLLLAVVHGPVGDDGRARAGGGFLPVRPGAGDRGFLARPNAPRQRGAPQRPHRFRHRGDHPLPAGTGLQGPRVELRHDEGRPGRARRATACPNGPRPGWCAAWAVRCRSSLCGGSTPSSTPTGNPVMPSTTPLSTPCRRRSPWPGPSRSGSSAHRPVPGPLSSAPGGGGRRRQGRQLATAFRHRGPGYELRAVGDCRRPVDGFAP